MPDISLCLNHSCPSAKNCYRHEATPTTDRQSYADFVVDAGSDRCKAFLTIRRKPWDPSESIRRARAADIEQAEIDKMPRAFWGVETDGASL